MQPRIAASAARCPDEDVRETMIDLRVALCTDAREFEALRTEWNDLLDRSRSRSIYLSWAWLYSWWTQFGASRALRLFLTRDPAGRLVGIAPLVLSREGFGGTLRVARFMGTEPVSSEYLDLIADATGEEEIVASLWRAIAAAADGWDWLVLTDVLESSLVLGHMQVLAAADGFRSDVQVAQMCPYLELPRDRDGFWGALKLGMRNNLRRKQKQLDAVGWSFETTADAVEMAEALEEFYRIHALRWSSRGLSGNFQDARVRAFHAQVSGYLAPEQRMRLYRLRVAGHTAAVIYALEYKGVVSDYQTGFDPAPPHPGIQPTKYSPGVVLIGHCLQDAIKRGSTEFDFLRGAEKYKMEWTRNYRLTYEQTLVAPGNVAAQMRFLISRAARRGKAAIKKIPGFAPASATDRTMERIRTREEAGEE